MAWNGNRLPQGVLVDQHREGSSVLEYFRVNAAIREALKPRVDLPSGGYIIIERTEALTVVDVNSGSFTRSATARETVLWTNCEAATEIARQLRLRNIAGVIIIDFIDMDARRDQLQVLEHFNKALKADKARPQIAQLTELGLVELTRKRHGQNIYELFGKPCQTCGGFGHLVHLPGEMPGAPGEMVERVPVLRTAEPVAIPTFRLPDVGGTTRSLEDPSDDLQELDLTNHPNYQDRGARRRRRGRRLGETLPRENAPPGKVLRQGSSNLTGSPMLVLDANGGGVGKKVEKALPERAKPSRSESLKMREDIPQEVISVNMTPREQEVFAFMGISPLVLFNGEVKNPRTAIIQVQPPGQDHGEAPDDGELTVVQPLLETPEEIPEETLAAEPSGLKGRVNKTKPIRSRTVAPSLEEEESSTVTDPHFPEVSIEVESSDDNGLSFEVPASLPKEDLVSEPRRRRRRSSAETAKAKQLSLGD
jgi:ribonuclease E